MGVCSNYPDQGSLPTGEVANYCEAIMGACGNTTTTPLLAQYQSWSQCMIEGLYFPRSAMVDDTSGNTFDCRLYYARMATQSPAMASMYCPSSGVNGQSLCGASQCESYCMSIMMQCNTTATMQYSSMAQCMAMCPGIPAGTFQPTDVSGDTLACRFYHGGNAALAQASMDTTGQLAHCTHAGAFGNGVCGSIQDGLCQIQTTVCTGSNQQYSSYSDCMTQTGSIATTGNLGDTSGNTIQCRAYHLSAAATSTANAAVHCPHIAVASAVCTGTSNTTTSSTASMTSMTSMTMMGSSTATTTGVNGASSLSASFALVAALAALLLAF